VHYPDDPEVYGLDYQFMVGPNLMVAPVLDPGEEVVEVYFPAGRWVHLWSGRKYGSLDKGVYATVRAPIGEPAVFYIRRVRRRESRFGKCSNGGVCCEPGQSYSVVWAGLLGRSLRAGAPVLAFLASSRPRGRPSEGYPEDVSETAGGATSS
jgi:hypothetical protein